MFLTQPALDLSVQAIEGGDFALYRRVNDLPQVLIGDAQTEVLATEAALLANFGRLVAILRATPGLSFARRVTAEEPFGRALIRATIETQAMRHGVTLADPVRGSIVWREDGPYWRASLVVNPLGPRLSDAEEPGR